MKICKENQFLRACNPGTLLNLSIWCTSLNVIKSYNLKAQKFPQNFPKKFHLPVGHLVKDGMHQPDSCIHYCHAAELRLMKERDE